ncbi:MAG: FKBP-type peptidyl-prolyl cis-trans isomerase [Bacteroidaceae bacterium]|nr:FKBP-type peptidyl-prolyl cis-trans isomerase [Bacteroidaceae bacterium]
MKKIFMAALVATTALMSACDNSGKTSANLKTDVDSLSYALGVANSPTEEQIKMYLMQSGSDSAYVEAFFKGLKDGLNSSSDKKEMAYQMGLQNGQQMKTRMFASIEQQVFAGDSTKSLSSKLFLAGMLEAFSGKTSMMIGKDTLNQQNAQSLIQTMMDRMSKAANAKVFGEAKSNSEKFMASKAKEAGVKPLKDGVLYKEIKAGTGVVAKMGQVAECTYEGRLANGQVFDSSKGNTVDFVVGQMIPGFNTALLSMKEGSEWEVYIPWNQAYGDAQQGPIPPYSTLVFKIKLVKVKDAPKANPAADMSAAHPQH